MRRFLRFGVASFTLATWSIASAQDGAALFATHCAACHQADGAGIPGAFPPLAGHAAELEAVDGGRRYLAEAVLFGLQGRITVDGATYDGTMPAHLHLSDIDVAAVLTHIVAGLGEPRPDFEAYSAEEVATARRGALSPQLVHERRPQLDEDDAAGAELVLASFTEAQVARARPIYERLCVECHGETFTGGLIGGPPLRGAAFLQRWGGRSVLDLFTFTRTQMPQGGPNTLSAQQYADLVALILSVNGHEAGDEELRGDPAALQDVGIRDP